MKLRYAFRYNDSRLFSKLVCWWFRTDTAHCEVIVSDTLCLSSSFLDKNINGKNGVRLKTIDMPSEKWRIYEYDSDATDPLDWYEKHKEYTYDHLAILGFLFRPLKDQRKGMTCSEVMASILKLEAPHTYAPHHIESYLKKVANRLQ